MYTEQEVSKNIRKSCVRGFFWSVIVFVFFLIGFLIGGLKYPEGKDDALKWFAIIIGAIGSFFGIKGIITNIVSFFDIKSFPMCEGIDSIEELTKIINETFKRKIYEDDEIILSSDFLIPKRNFNYIIRTSDIIWVYQYSLDKHTTFGKMAIGRSMMIYTINSFMEITYNTKKVSQLESAIIYLKKINQNTLIGYTRNNKKKYDEIINEIKTEKNPKRTIMECKVCGKPTLYNEYGTCEECHQKIVERIKEKESNFSKANLESDIEEDISIKEDNRISEKEIPEILKKYKELLDMGAITQEEFDKKKKELLDL